MRLAAIVLMATALAAAGAVSAAAQRAPKAKSDAELIANAMSAAPALMAALRWVSSVTTLKTIEST